MNRRGQAALEFLTTYGWAFLVILVMIGALAYFGVLNPERFLPDRCQFQTGWTCERYVLNEAGNEAVFEIRNDGQDTVNLADLQYRDDSGTWVSCTNPTIDGDTINDDIFVKGTTAQFICPIGAGKTLVGGEKTKVELRFRYNLGSTQSAAFQTWAGGEIYAEVNE
ncbi:hypothetical protein JXA12_05125 [Candidatus Woesearchaeota archaeon]|nr:hypothetical protein [Candidatus Woesearchaeota archaeon]